MTSTFAHLAQHGVPDRDIELLSHWFSGFPEEVQDPQLAVLWALQTLPWDRNKALLAEAYDAALEAPGVLLSDDERLQQVSQLLHAPEVDEEVATQASDECYRVVEAFARKYRLSEEQDPGERIAEAMGKVVLNPEIDPTVRVWLGSLPVLGAIIASTFRGKVENYDQLVARSVYSALVTLLQPPKQNTAHERAAALNRMLRRTYAELASYMSTWVRPWGT